MGALGRAAEVQLFGDGDEVAQLAQVKIHQDSYTADVSGVLRRA
jgi:hypothetical protein